MEATELQLTGRAIAHFPSPMTCVLVVTDYHRERAREWLLAGGRTPEDVAWLMANMDADLIHRIAALHDAVDDLAARMAKRQEAPA